MDEAWKILDSLEGVENAVNAAYYGVAADYYKVCLSLPPPLYCERERLMWMNKGKSGLRAVLQALASLPCLCGSGERFVA